MEETREIEHQTLAAKATNIKVSKVIVIQPPKRDPLDIGKLTNSIKSTDKGKRASLYDVYENIIKDPVIGESIRKRIRNVTLGGLVFQADKKEVDEMTDLIKSPSFRIMLREILLTRFFGKTVLELDFTDGFKVDKLSRKNLDTAKKVILKNISDSDGIPYENDDFLLNIGEDDDLGLLMEAAPFAIFKRNGGADYAEFCEKWGIPILAALYDPEDENARKEMEDTMLARGAGGSVVMSKNSDLKSIDNPSSGAVHDKFLDWLDEQILIGLIGQTMTTRDGSSRSQSETHKEVQEGIFEDDREYVTEYLNHFFLPKIEKRGYPVKNGWFLYPKKNNLTLMQMLEIAKEVDDRTPDGVDIDYWYETFGLPKGNKSQNQKEDKTPNEQTKKEGKPEETKTAEDKKPTKVKAKGLSMYDKLLNFFGDAPQ